MTGEMHNGRGVARAMLAGVVCNREDAQRERCVARRDVGQRETQGEERCQERCTSRRDAERHTCGRDVWRESRDGAGAPLVNVYEAHPRSMKVLKLMLPRELTQSVQVGK